MLDVLVAGSLTVLMAELLAGAGDLVVLPVALVVATAYELVFLRALRATPGKLVAGVRVAERDAWTAGEARALGTGRLLARSLIVGTAVVLPVIGLAYAAVCVLAMVRHPLRLTPHDHVARSVVTVRS